MMADRRTAHTRQTDRARILSRRAEVSRLRLAGWSQPAIADAVGVAQSTVCEDLAAVFDEWRESANRDVGALVAEQSVRLDALLAAVWPEAVPEDGSKPSYTAVDRALAILSRQARLHGLDGSRVDGIITAEMLDREMERLERELAKYDGPPA